MRRTPRWKRPCAPTFLPATPTSGCRDIPAIRPRRISPRRSTRPSMPTGSPACRRTPPARSTSTSPSAGACAGIAAATPSVTQRDEPIHDYLAALARRDRHGGGPPAAPPAGRPSAFRRRHADHRRAGRLPRADGAAARQAFDIRPGAEVAIEIDPRTLTPAMAEALGEAGINRASLGVQSLDPAVQHGDRPRPELRSRPTTRDRSACAPPASPASTSTSSTACRTRRSPPASTRSTSASRSGRTASRSSAMPMCRASSATSARSTRQPFPAAPARNAQAEAIAERLEAAGYERIGLDHYALPDDAMAVAADDRAPSTAISRATRPTRRAR